MSGWMTRVETEWSVQVWRHGQPGCDVMVSPGVMSSIWGVTVAGWLAAVGAEEMALERF